LIPRCTIYTITFPAHRITERSLDMVLVASPLHHHENMFSLATLAFVAAVTTTASAQTVHAVQVGASGLTFTPNQVTASVGDIVSFQFFPADHSATQVTFATPCTPMSGGFNSGFMAVSASSTTHPTFNVTVNATTPIWVSCQQTGHCPAGMVMAINVNASTPNSFAAFLANAEGHGSSSGSGTTGSSAAASTPSGSSSSGNTGAYGSSGSSHTAIVSVGATMLAAVAALTFGFF